MRPLGTAWASSAAVTATTSSACSTRSAVARSSRKAGMSATSVDGPATGRISAACDRADQPGPSGMNGNCDV